MKDAGGWAPTPVAPDGYLRVRWLGGLQHVGHGAGQVLGCAQQLLAVPAFIIHERRQQFDSL